MSRIFLAVCSVLSVGLAARAEVDYEADIKPIFAEKCGSCHGVLQQEAGLRLDAGSLIRGEGVHEGVLDLENPMASKLIQRVTSGDTDLRMPPTGDGTPLSDRHVDLLVDWIRAGATSPEDEIIVQSPSQHWAYQRPVRPTLPEEDSVWRSNPIDALMYVKWREVGLTPAPLATRDALLRRLHFDVIGLPPNLDQQATFLHEDSVDAWPNRVDQLLDDPGYGEKWGRHWMDIWRYSDWDGYKNELRGSQRHIWHWRDWIVESLNSDKGYDEMVREMVAGDEIEPENLDVLRATGFLVRNFHKSNRDIWLDATTEHTAKAFLGMTIACARCHDHKYDPISQQEYYAFRAIFEPHRVRTQRLPGQPDTVKMGLPHAFDSDLDAETYLYVRGNEKTPDKDHPIHPAAPRIVDVPFKFDSIKLGKLASNPFLREYIETEEIENAKLKLEAARKRLLAGDDDKAKASIARQQVKVCATRLSSLQLRWNATKSKVSKKSDAPELAISAANAERSWKYQQSLLDVLNNREAVATAKASKEAGEAKRKSAIDAAEKKLAMSETALVNAAIKTTAVDGEFTPVGNSYPSTSSGRRTALADWITAPKNPLTARVAINHIWTRYFGEPLVETVDDFGLRAHPPPNQDVLDWLAVELIENDWSMKHIHRLILNSRTYRLASSGKGLSTSGLDRNRVVDADNLYLWRANVRRLNAEQVRDSLLAVGGTLDRTMGGPDIDSKAGERVLRRSLYFRHAYEKQMPMLVLFDAANPTDCYRRSESIVPQQALALANSTLALDQAREASRRINENASDDRSFVQIAYRWVLGREATLDEQTACEQFLHKQSELLANANALSLAAGTSATTVAAHKAPRKRARENLVHVLINHNDFVTVR